MDEQKLREAAFEAMIATGNTDPVAAINQVIRENYQMREAIYKNAPPRQFRGGLPDASPERDKYLAQFGITDAFLGCCNG